MTSPLIALATSAFLEKTGDTRQLFRKKHRYYHDDDLLFLRKCTQPDNVLFIIGSNVVELALRLNSRKTIFIELDPTQPIPVLPDTVVKAESLEGAFVHGPIDYVLLPYSLQIVEDIQGFLEELHVGLSENTRVITIQYNFLWAPLIRLAQRLGIKSPMPDLNWLNLTDIQNLFLITNYQTLTQGARCLIPYGVPFISNGVNQYFAPLPIFQWCCQKTYVIARSLSKRTADQPQLSVSVVVPARNEAGNIRSLMDRLPMLGHKTELIFIEGHSKDETWKEILTQTKIHPRRALFQLQTHQQQGEGKADAVRLGFSHSTGDLLIILDADLSVQPEDLVHFLTIYQRGAAEFLNGSRLVYQMERQAMQILNLFFNKVFASLLSWLIGQKVKDTLCGTKVLSRKNYLRIRTHLQSLGRLDPFGDFELLLGASRLNLKISDVPIRYKERAYGSTNIRRFRHGLRLLHMVLSSFREMK